MKLDKIRFASLISMISGFGASLDTYRIQDIDDVIDVEIPPAPAMNVNVNDLHVLMALMQEGTRKIEAIKLHRSMTGYGLKESKDAVEKYWPITRQIQDALDTAKTGDALIEVARNAHRAEMELASQHNEEGATLSDILGKAIGKAL